MSEIKLEAPESSELGYGQLFGILQRRSLWLIGCLACTLPLAALLTTFQEPTYESGMQFLVEPTYQDNADTARSRSSQGSQFLDTPLPEIDYSTQIRLMTSSEVLQRAIDTLKIEYPDIHLKTLKRSLGVSQILDEKKQETNILQVDYVSNDPVKTQKVLQVLQNVYIEYSLQQQELRLSRGLAFINQQIPTASQSVNQAERALEEFREDRNLVNPEGQVSELTNALGGIKRDRQDIRAQYADAEARYRSLQQQVAQSPRNALMSSRLSESERYQALLDELQKTELTLARQQIVYTDDAPNMRSLLQQLQQQKALLQQEAQRVLADFPEQGVLSEQDLLADGQLGEVDLNLISQLVATQTELAGLAARERSLEQSEQQLRAELNQFPSLIAEYDRLQPEVQVRRDTLKQLLQARQELSIEIARGGFNWQVIETPQMGEKTGPSLQKNLVLGGIFGLFLGSIAAFLRESMDDTLYDTNRLREMTGLTLLGSIPELPGLDIYSVAATSMTNISDSDTLFVSQAVHWLPFREALDLIYKNIRILSTSSSLKLLAVTSSLPGEGKSTVAVGLALSAARLGQRVLLLDTDLRYPSLHAKLELPNTKGLSTLLEGQDKPQLHALTPHLDVLTAGPVPVDPVQLLHSQSMKDWMKQFEQDYDLVIVDTPPTLGMADAIEVASLCDALVLVARIGKLSQGELIQALPGLNGLNVLGVIANSAEPMHTRYEYGGYVVQRSTPKFSFPSPSKPSSRKSLERLSKF